MIETFDMRIIQEAKNTMRNKFPDMVSYFLEDSEVYVNEIRAGISGSNYGNITPAAHTLKSSSRLMGAIRLSAIAREIEELSRENAGEEKLKGLLPALEQAYLEVVEGFKKI